MVRVLTAAAVVLVCAAATAVARETTTLKAADGLTVTADVYRAHENRSAPWIVLAHQAGASRGEYLEIAPRLNRLGFNAIALDQRSGKTFAGVRNQTAGRAAKQRKRRNYLAARPDILAGIAWAREQTDGLVIVWGSSYSAALALLIAGEAPDRVDGVVSMSPGEYIRGKSIGGAAARIKVPVLITSPANERRRWKGIYGRIPHDRKVGYAPTRGGRHGSSALIAGRNKSAATYWQVVEKFLADHFK